MVRFYHWILTAPTFQVIKIELLPQVKTQGCLLAVFKEKLAEFVITPELAISFELALPLLCLSECDDVSQKVWPT